MNVLAINFNHDGAAVVVCDGEIAGYANTERFSRCKKHPGIREQDLCEVLAQAGIGIDEIDLIQLLNLNRMDSRDIPKLYGSNLKQTWPDFWINNRFDKVRLLGHDVDCRLSKLHHYFHAALAYIFSPFESGVSFACDPVGAQAFLFVGAKLVPAPPARRMVASGVYGEVAALLFGTSVIGAGKLMGLAPYGADGRIVDYDRLMTMKRAAAFEELVKITTRDPIILTESSGPLNASLAYHAQAFLEHELSKVFDELYDSAVRLGVEPNLCLSGGTALNSSANQRCFSHSRFRRLYLHPACGDDGTAIGAALAHWHFELRQPRTCRPNRDAMYSKRTYDHCIESAIRKHHHRLVVTSSDHETDEAAALLAAGKVVGWFQGASEIGPRALGNRSILADPRSPVMRDHLNHVVKRREGFRPFAPSVLAGHAREWFGIDDSPFMLRVAPVRRNDVPAVTHVDGTSRIQTVRREDNPRYYELIERFNALTGVPMVLNTSFNGKGAPIVETPEDAISCMFESGLDALVFPGFVLRPR